MFQFPPFAPSYDGDRPSACRVAPFGHSRITSCLRIPVNFRSLPRPSSPPDSLGIPRSPFSSFSRELQSLNTVAHRIQRLSSCLVFAYEIAVPNSQLEKTLELSTNYKLIFFSIFTSYSLSMLSMNCHALPAACAVFQKRLNYSYLNHTSRSFLPLHSNRELVSDLTPKRRCSSHTFRYGYLVTT